MDYRKPISQSVDLSHISHFIIYFIFGLLYPNKYKIVLYISILWEIFEIIIVHNDILYYLTKTYWIIPEIYWNETIKNKIIDFIANFSGYYLGSKLLTVI
jgi:hypothetical protein